MAQSPIAADNPGMVPEHLRWLGLNVSPFPVTPDSKGYFLFGALHQAYLELKHFIEQRKGFILVTGDVGVGKTSLTRKLLAEMGEAGCCTSLVLNTFVQGAELLGAINHDFGIGTGEISLTARLEALNAFLLQARNEGRNCLLVIDDAQGLSVESLELLRQISNLETSDQKLIQIVLIAQPEIVETLDRFEIRQLRSRIVLHLELHTWHRDTVDAYIRFRQSIAGNPKAFSIDSGALAELVRFTGGYPRSINHVLDRCLYGLYARQERRIGIELMRQAQRETGIRPMKAGRWTWPAVPFMTRGIAAGAGFVLAGLLAMPLWQEWKLRQPVGERTAPGAHLTATGSPRAHIETFWAAYEGLAPLADTFNDIEASRLGEIGLAAGNQGWTIHLSGIHEPANCQGKPAIQLPDGRSLSLFRDELPAAPPLFMQDSAEAGTLQSLLVRIGYLSAGVSDGVMGPRTLSALSRFQTDHGLPANAQLDEATRYALSCAAGGSRSATAAPSGPVSEEVAAPAVKLLLSRKQILGHGLTLPPAVMRSVRPTDGQLLQVGQLLQPEAWTPAQRTETAMLPGSRKAASSGKAT